MKLIFYCLGILSMGTLVLLGCSESDQPFAVDPSSSTFESSLLAYVQPYEAEFRTTGHGVVGTLQAWIEGDYLIVKYAVRDGWNLDATQVAVAANLEGIPLTSPRMPKWQAFPYQMSHQPGADEYSWLIDLLPLGLAGSPDLVIVARAEMHFAGLHSESVHLYAFASGIPFPNRSEDPPWRVTERETFEPLSWERGRPAYCAINAERLRGLTLENRLGSVAQIATSVLGPGGVVIGDVSFEDCEIDKGVQPMARSGNPQDPDNCVDFAGLNLTPVGTLEFWYWPLWEPDVDHMVDILHYGPTGDCSRGLLGVEYDDWSDTFSVLLRNRPSPTADWIAVRFHPDQLPMWDTGEPMRIGIVWDGREPATQDRVRLFVDGFDVTSHGGWVESEGSPNFMQWSTNTVLRLGARLGPADWDAHPWEGTDQVFDEIKAWRAVKREYR